jgi:Glycosyl transferase family 2
VPENAISILTSINASPEAVVRSLMSLRQTSSPIVYLHGPGEEPPRGPDVKAIETEATTLGAMLEVVRTAVDSDLYVWIPPGVEVERQAIQYFIDQRTQDPEAALIVSDYRLKDRPVEIHPFTDDLTEREDFGAIWGIPGNFLDAVGGADRSLKYTTFYDLRLKLMERGPVTRIASSTHSIHPPEDDSKVDENVLFYPGGGAFGGFSYLFMDKEEEAETEQVFYNCLRRRDAFMELPENEVPRSPLNDGDPIVTVVIPVHNRGRLLGLALDSVLANTMQNIEVIVVDNASRDNSREVAEEYAVKDSRVRVLVSEVNLIARALNMGIEAARGRYIAQLDSDDEYVPHTLQSMVEHLEAHPKCALAISYYELMDEGGTTLTDFGIIEHLEYNLNNILRVDGAGALRCWSKSAVQEMGGFSENDFPNYGEDYDLVLKVSEKYHVDRVHDVLYRYRRHPGNTDALRLPVDKIQAKTFARTCAIERRRKLNGSHQ